jgi:hypothetical protein
MRFAQMSNLLARPATRTSSRGRHICASLRDAGLPVHRTTTHNCKSKGRLAVGEFNWSAQWIL